jgi:hypothetical protein
MAKKVIEGYVIQTAPISNILKWSRKVKAKFGEDCLLEMNRWLWRKKEGMVTKRIRITIEEVKARKR